MNRAKGIYAVRREWESHAWLCGKHVAAREKAGWTCKPHADLTFVAPCDDCVIEQQGSTVGPAGGARR